MRHDRDRVQRDRNAGGEVGVADRDHRAAAKPPRNDHAGGSGGERRERDVKGVLQRREKDHATSPRSGRALGAAGWRVAAAARVCSTTWV